MRITTGSAIVALALLLGAAPSFAQGVYHTPPSPNSAQSMPEAPDSAPLTARTLSPGTTGIQQIGSVGTTRVQPAPYGWHAEQRAHG